MKFVIITNVVHKNHQNKWYGYEPYVREMNLWLKDKVTETKIVAPVFTEISLDIDSSYNSNHIEILKVPTFNFLNFKEIFFTILKLPYVIFKILQAFIWADHIHLRCPGNMGVLGSVIQVFFPHKPKTVKYAGNWDPESKQPLSYRLQKWIISNTFLTRNAKVLVYGEWENQTRNIQPFFTATYSESEIEELPEKNLKKEIRFIYVGAFTKGKQPIKSVRVIEKLKKNGYSVFLDMYGEGDEYKKVKKYIETNQLMAFIKLHGNTDKEKIKKAFQKSHFLIFISKSEGWPKVVAEAMFWSCLPISSSVSCVPNMLGNGTRGGLVDDDNTLEIIEIYLKDEKLYQEQVVQAKKWSQNYTLEKFDIEIQKLL